MILWLWLAFLVVVGTLVVVDLGLVTRRPRFVTPIEALASFSLWVLSALGFSLLVLYVYEKNWLDIEHALAGVIGPHPADLDGQAAWAQWVTAYIIELALSLDNIAIAALLLRHFKIPRPLVARTLFWNTLISLVVRLVMILASAWLLMQFGWVKWAFCGVLVLAMLRTLLAPDEHTDFDRTLRVRFIRRLIPVSGEDHGLRLFARANGRLSLTPVAMVALISRIADLTFAVDSVPALFSVTRDPFLAFTASAFALMALRSLYFALSGVLGRFRYLRVSIVFVLLAVAGKMFLVSRDSAYFNITPTIITLGLVAAVIGLGVGASALRHRLRAGDKHDVQAPRPTPLEDLSEAVDASRRNFRKVVILIIGSIIILAGIAIAPLPGPGPMVLVPIGLAILATEFIWAKKLLNTFKKQAQALSERADKAAARTSPWLVPPALIAFAAAVFAGLRYFPNRTVMVCMIALGPALIIGFWAFKTLRAALRARRQRLAGGQPATKPNPISKRAVDGPPAA